MVITIAIIIIILSYVGLGVHTLIIYMCLPRDSCGYVVTFHGVYFTKISFPLLWVYTYRSNQVLSLLLRGVHWGFITLHDNALAAGPWRDVWSIHERTNEWWWDLPNGIARWTYLSTLPESPVWQWSPCGLGYSNIAERHDQHDVFHCQELQKYVTRIPPSPRPLLTLVMSCWERRGEGVRIESICWSATSIQSLACIPLTAPPGYVLVNVDVLLPF